MRAAIIFNPTKISEDELASALADIEHTTGDAHARLIATTRKYSATEAAADAIADGAELVIACGGDGTVRQAAAAVAESDASTALGIVPLGTGNLLARNVGIDTQASLVTYLLTAFTGIDRPLDACELRATLDDGSEIREWFTVIAGMGIDAGMIRYTNEDAKERYGWPAYIGGIARTLRRQPEFTARYRLDDKPTYGVHAASVMLMNCGQLQGGLTLAPKAKPDDGRLDVVVARARGPLGWFDLALAGILRSIVRAAPQLRPLLLDLDARRKLVLPRTNNRPIVSEQGRAVAFAIDSHSEPFQLDGDLIGQVRAGTVVVHPGALTVRVPAERHTTDR